MNSAVLVLLSGGIDSCATLALYRRRSARVSALFVDYGQAAAVQERVAVQNIAAHYEIECAEATCAGVGSFGAGYVRGRNALLLQLALAKAVFDVGHIAIGIHAGTSYVDCGSVFIAEMQRVFDIYCDGRIRIVAPFIDRDKRGVVDYCQQAHVPIEMTYSCELGVRQGCGDCSSCLDRKALNVVF